MNSSFATLFSQLAIMAPLLLVYLVGLVLVIVYWRRAPLSAMLALIGLIILVLAMFGSPLIQMFIANASRPVSSLGQTITLLSFAFSILRAIGMGLLIAAIFTNRRPAIDFGFTVEASHQPPMAEYAQHAAFRQ